MPAMTTVILIRLMAFVPLPISHLLAEMLALLLWLLPLSRKKVTQANIDACMPELSVSQRRRMARRAFVSELKTALESPRLWYGSERVFRRMVKSTENQHLVDEALAKGKGILLLTPHIGNWELAGMQYSLDYSLTGLYKPQKGAIEEAIKAGRERFGVVMVPTIPGVVGKKILPVLQGNGTVFFMPDQDPPPGSGTFVPFFGITAHSPVFVPRLVQKTGCTVLFFYGRRLPWGRGFSMHYQAADPAVADPDIDRATAAINSGVEECVRKFPEQYWWGYERFRRRPPGTAPFYTHKIYKEDKTTE